jgi:cystathionine beta-synthase
VRSSYSISDEESFMTARVLLEREGLLGGSSTGLLLATALRYCRAQTTPKRVVSFVCDSGNKYLSKMYNDYWMREQGFLREAPRGDLRDVMTRSAEQHAVIAVAPSDRLLVAYSRMKLYDVSQLPVLDGEQIVGILDESDLLIALSSDSGAFQRQVDSIMTQKLTTVQVRDSVESLFPVFERGLVAIVCDGPRFLGLITRIDVLNYLRRKLS